MHVHQVPEECRADYEKARAIVAELLRQIRREPQTRPLERAAGHRLALEWFAIVAATYGLIFADIAVWLKVVLLIPWSIYSALALDTITHYANHWPLFQGRVANALFRWSGALVLFNPLEIKHVHSDHHRAYSRPDCDDERVFTAADRAKSFWWYCLSNLIDGIRVLVPWRAMAPCVTALRATRPAEFREIVLMRWSFPVVVGVLALFDAWSTLALFVPVVAVVGSFASLIMNLTDHVPGDPRHPFRLATYLEPETRGERVFAELNHHTAATHLTHHLFPQVHWVHLPRIQRALAAIYARHGAPRSLLVNSALIGNPLRFLAVLRAIERRRFEL